jgi:hypothetical protein
MKNSFQVLIVAQEGSSGQGFSEPSEEEAQKSKIKTRLASVLYIAIS